MKKMIFVLGLLAGFCSLAFADSYSVGSRLSSMPRYIFNPTLAYLEKIGITPNKVRVGDEIHFDLKLIGRNDLNVDMFYLLAGGERVFLTRLTNNGNGFYSGSYRIPNIALGLYTDFQAVARNKEGEQVLFTGVFPGIEVIPEPRLTTSLSPLTIFAGEPIQFSVDVVGFDAARVDVFYQDLTDRFFLTRLSSPNGSQFQGMFWVPETVVPGVYDGFLAVATEANSQQVYEEPFREIVTVTELITECADLDVTVVDLSGFPIAGANLSIAGQNATTDSLGKARFVNLQDGSQLLVTEASGFGGKQTQLSLSCTQAATVRVILDICAQVDFFAFYPGQTAQDPVAGAIVTVSDTAGQSYKQTTDANGRASFTRLNPGTLAYSVSEPDFNTATGTFQIQSCRTSPNDTIQIDVPMTFLIL